MTNLIRFIFLVGFPGKMPLRDAPMAPISTGVSGLVQLGGRLAMCFFADDAMGIPTAPAVPQKTIAASVPIERPDKAFVAIVGHDDFAEEALSLIWPRAKDTLRRLG